MSYGAPVATAWEVLARVMYAKGVFVQIDFAGHPVWFVALFPLLTLCQSAHLFVIHRALHWKPLYVRVHAVHHRNVSPTSWSGLSMHPIEHLLYFSTLVFFFVLPIHPAHLLFILFYQLLSAPSGHSGFEAVGIAGRRMLPLDAFFHHLHHRYFECNYGSGEFPLDRWLGLRHNGSPAATDTKSKSRDIRGLYESGCRPLAQEDGKDRFVAAVRDLSRAFALAVPSDETTRIRDDVGFLQAVQSVLAKRAATDTRPREELDNAVRRIISRAVAPEGVIDIFAAAGLPKPDISILSDEFLAEVRGMEHRNLAVELLQKLLKGEVAVRRRRNVVQARSFAEMLDLAIRRYQNRSVAAAQVIEELIELAREMREAGARGEQLGLSDDELAFYDAVTSWIQKGRCNLTG